MTEKTRINKILRILILIIISLPVNAQVKTEAGITGNPSITKEESLFSGDTKPNFKKNAMHSSVGILVLYATVNGYLEHMIFENMRKKYNATFIRLGFGQYGELSETNSYAILQAVGMTGHKKGHLESAYGIVLRMIRDNSSYENEIGAAFSLGYRWQKPEGHFLFRTGLAYPEALYLGIGICF